MVNQLNKNLIRAGILLIYLFIISVIIIGVSGLYSYLNTGADRSKILHIEQFQEDYYTPAIEWDITQVEGRQMDPTTLKNVEEDYLNAWFIKSKCLATNTFNGITDYYTTNTANEVKQLIADHKNKNLRLQTTSLEHDVKVQFFSEDGTMVVLSDRNVLEHQQLYRGDAFISKKSSISNYQVILLLEDGYWRIRKIIKESSSLGLPELTTREFKEYPKGINYYPQDHPWDTFGSHFSEQTITNDFNIIKDAGLNSIRIFIGYEDFGKNNPDPKKIERLLSLLNIAQEKNLNVLVTLFDFYGDYSITDWTLTQEHLIQIVNNIKDHPAIMGWDIKNEPDLDLDSRGREIVLSWVEHMAYRIKKIDTKNPVTVGWSSIDAAYNVSHAMDFITFHYYLNLDDLTPQLNALREEVKKPMVVTEYGLSSYSGVWNLFRSSEENQANYHKKAQELFTATKLPFMSWTLYDFRQVPKKVVGSLPWRKNPQKKYGFINVQGEKKAAFQHIAK